MKYHVLIFDLDDTLFDTCGQLVDRASRESCLQMIELGLQADVDSCMQKRQELFKENPRKNIYDQIVQSFGVLAQSQVQAQDQTQRENAVARAGEKAFLDREVEKDIFLFPETFEILQVLQGPYKLFLVTSGTPATQKQKVELLGLDPFFQEIFYVDLLRGETKKTAFQNILQKYSVPAEACLSIGNRIDHEIREAKELGMDTCYLVHGNYTHLKPKDKMEIPDYQIQSFREITRACQL